MDITVRVSLTRITGPAATAAEVRDQLVEEIASIAQFAVEHTEPDGSQAFADYVVEQVRAFKEES